MTISVGNDYFPHVAFNDEAWTLLMQQQSIPETAQM
jgi:hypothetical protein